jgi:hypothetical protein
MGISLFLFSLIVFAFTTEAVPGIPPVLKNMVTVAVHEGLDCEGIFSLIPVAVDKKCQTFYSSSELFTMKSMLISCNGYQQVFLNQTNCYGSTTEPLDVSNTCFNFPLAVPSYSAKFSCNDVNTPIRMALYSFGVSNCEPEFKVLDMYLVQNQCQHFVDFENGYTEVPVFSSQSFKAVWNMETYVLDVFFFDTYNCDSEPVLTVNYANVLDGRCVPPNEATPAPSGDGILTRRRLEGPPVFPFMIRLFDGSLDEEGTSFALPTPCLPVDNPQPCESSSAIYKKGPDTNVFVVYIILIFLFIF